MIFLRVVGDDQQFPEKRVFSIEKVNSFLPKIIYMHEVYRLHELRKRNYPRSYEVNFCNCVHKCEDQSQLYVARKLATFCPRLELSSLSTGFSISHPFVSEQPITSSLSKIDSTDYIWLCSKIKTSTVQRLPVASFICFQPDPVELSFLRYFARTITLLYFTFQVHHKGCNCASHQISSTYVQSSQFVQQCKNQQQLYHMISSPRVSIIGVEFQSYMI